MDEIFTRLDLPYNKYEISNYGRIRRNNHFLTLIKRNDDNYYMSLLVKGKKYNVHPNVLCYKYFGKDYVDGAKVYHKDGDKTNNHIDNLYICMCHTNKPTQEQIDIYCKSVIPCVKHISKQMGFTRLMNEGFDFDNFLGECYYMLWKHLPQLIGNFYGYAKKYVMYVYLQQYKQYKKYTDHFTYIDDLQQENIKVRKVKTYG